MVPRAVLMKSGLVSINTARQNISKIAVSVNTVRQVNVAHSKTTVNAAKPMSYLSKISHSTVKRPIHKNTSFKNSNIDQRVNIVSGKKINTARPKAVVNAVKGNILCFKASNEGGIGLPTLSFSTTCFFSNRLHSDMITDLVSKVAIPLGVGNFIIEWMVEGMALKALRPILPNITL
ncbi:hypothetical protein Tco_0452680 [Tanacetum coccineum]